MLTGTYPPRRFSPLQVDWDRSGRRAAVELREYGTLQLAAPTQLVANSTEGVYLTWEAELPVRHGLCST